MSDATTELKALLLLQDVLTSGGKVSLKSALTVQHFTYKCQRHRAPGGNPYGPTLQSFLDFSVKVATKNTAKALLERINSPETFPYSFLFDTKFASDGKLSDYQGVLVANGYLVDLEESFESTNHKEGETPAENEQMLISARILLSNIVYGYYEGSGESAKAKSLKLIITND